MLLRVTDFLTLGQLKIGSHKALVSAISPIHIFTLLFFPPSGSICPAACPLPISPGMAPQGARSYQVQNQRPLFHPPPESAHPSCISSLGEKQPSPPTSKTRNLRVSAASSLALPALSTRHHVPWTQPPWHSPWLSAPPDLLPPSYCTLPWAIVGLLAITS